MLSVNLLQLVASMRCEEESPMLCCSSCLIFYMKLHWLKPPKQRTTRVDQCHVKMQMMPAVHASVQVERKSHTVLSAVWMTLLAEPSQDACHGNSSAIPISAKGQQQLQTNAGTQQCSTL
jgi:hypothetical protein